MEIDKFELLTVLNALQLDKEVMCCQDLPRYHFISKLQSKLFKVYYSLDKPLIYPDNFQ